MKNLTGLVYNDAFSSIQSVIQNWTGRLQNITLAVVVGCLVIIGLMFIFGEGPSQKAKKWLVYIIIGSMIVWGAAAIGNTIQGVTNGF